MVKLDTQSKTPSSLLPVNTNERKKMSYRHRILPQERCYATRMFKSSWVMTVSKEHCSSFLKLLPSYM